MDIVTAEPSAQSEEKYKKISVLFLERLCKD